MKFGFACLLAGLVLLLGGSAAAVPQDDVDTEIAKRHFRKGRELYVAGNYEGALAEFQAAQLARPLPAFSYNIARCFDRMERLEEAIVAYQAYLDEGPAAHDVESVRQRIEQLRERAIAQAKLRGGAAAGKPLPPPEAAKAGVEARNPLETKDDELADLDLQSSTKPASTPAQPEAASTVGMPVKSEPASPASASMRGPDRAAEAAQPLALELAPPSDQPAGKPLTRYRATWSLAAVTAALLVGSLASLGVAHSRYQKWEKSCDAAGGCSQTEIDYHVAPDVNPPYEAGYALMGIAGGTAVGLIVAAILESRAARAVARPSRVGWAPAPSGVEVAF